MRILLILIVLLVAAPAVEARTVDGGFGADRLNGTAGRDVLHGSEGPDVLRGRGGDDLLTGDTGPDSLHGGGGDDVMTGSAGRDLLRGGSGDDVVSAGYGADVVFGGSGHDAIDGGADHDAIDGGPGDDLIHGGSGIDHLAGGPGDDRIWADGGADHLRGGDGDDTIYVEGTSGLRVRCGAGHDTVVLLARPEVYDAGTARPYVQDPECERAELSTALDDESRGRTYLAPERGGRHVGTDADDKLLGGLGADHLIGGRGDDVLWGMHIENGRSNRPDRLVGGPDDDLIYGGPGRQRIDAGPGDDTVMSGVGDGDIRGGAGADTIRLRGTGRVRVRAGSGDDVIHARGPSRGRISCGSGRDVAHVDRGDRVSRDCERVTGRARAASADTMPPETFAATKVGFAAETLLAFTADEPATFECQQGGPHPHPQRWAPCTSPVQLPAAGWVHVRAVDLAGNADASPAPLRTTAEAWEHRRHPAFAHSQHFVWIQGGASRYQCSRGGGAWEGCGSMTALPLLPLGPQHLRIRLADRPAVAMLEFRWTVEGGSAVTAVDFPTVLASSRDLLTEPPKLRVAAPAATSAHVAVVDGRGAVRWSRPLALAPGANAVEVPGRVLAALPSGRHVLVVATATGAQRLPFAIVPLRR